MTFKHKPFHIAGCDTRKVGHLYLYTYGSWRQGDSLEEAFRSFAPFVLDPPVYVDDYRNWGISTQGISISSVNGVYHAFDWVGGDYPNAADILMECMIKDGSGLYPLNEGTLPGLELLEPGESDRYLVHPDGLVFNPEELFAQRIAIPEGPPDCFLPEDEQAWHKETGEYCASLHWQWVRTKGRKSKEVTGRIFNRQIGDISYPAARPPEDWEPETGVALIARIPIHEIHLVVGDMDENDPDMNKKIQKAAEMVGGLDLSLPFFLTDN
jgi:hypothetical protein